MPSLLDVSTLEIPPPPARLAGSWRLRLTIALHPDLRRIGDRFEVDDDDDLTLALSRSAPEFRAPLGRSVGPLADPHLSRAPLRLVRRRGGVVVARAGSKTALRVGAATDAETLHIDDAALQRGVALTLAERVILLLQRIPVVDEDLPKYGLVGESAAIHRVRREIAAVAGLHMPVLIRGESGAGKELVARAIHTASPRAARPYVSINMAALPPSIAAAELFGHARGSFTGAVQARDGYFREANGGTIFLDEVSEASLEVQAALLRVLETGEVQAIGGGAARRVDVRVLAATDAHLEPMMAAGTFRPALFHRLAAYELAVTPLRERREDIARLFAHFLEGELRRAGRAELFERIAVNSAAWVPPTLIEALLASAWPGNVRELSNVSRRVAAVLHADADIHELIDGLRGAPIDGVSAAEEAPSPAHFSDAALLAALEDNAWNISATARTLGLSRTTLYARIRRASEIGIAKDLTRAHLAELRARHGDDLEAMAAEARVSVRALQLRLQAVDLGE